MTKNEVVNPEKLSVIKNGISFDNLLKMPVGRKSPVPLGTIARLTRQKGLIHLIDAMVILGAAFEIEPELIIVGDGPLRRKLEEEVFKYGISHRVKFEGSIENTVPYYKKFGTFILPSMWEGLPLVLLEAMAAGLPIISTNTSGVLDVIEDEKDGLVVEKGNAEALALEIKRLMDEPELAKSIAENARKKVVKEYSVEKFAKATADLYKKLIKQTN
jgi:glycosyltransferase involved in cell wall biosynthesis